MKRGRGLHEGCRVRCIVASQGQGVKNITSGGRFNRKTTPVSVLVLSSPGDYEKETHSNHIKAVSSTLKSLLHIRRSRIEAVFLVMASSPVASTLQNKEASSQHNYFFGKKRLKIPLIHWTYYWELADCKHSTWKKLWSLAFFCHTFLSYIILSAVY